MAQQKKSFTQPWGWSKLEQYRTCPFKFYNINVLGRKEPENAAMRRGGVVHKDIESYVNGWVKTLTRDIALTFWKPKLDALKKRKPATEQSWGFDIDWKLLVNWFHPSTRMRAKSDTFYQEGEELVLVDYKTGKFREPSEDQIILYGVAGHAAVPGVKRVRTSFWFLDQEEAPMELLYNERELLAARKDFDKEAAKLYKDKAFKPTPGDHCRYCIFSRQKGGPCQY